MILARVVGTVVATRKDPRLEGCKLIIVQPVSPEGKPEGGYIVSIDTVSAGNRELVLCVSGSSARMAEGCKDKPIDNAIIGIVDSVSLDEPIKAEPIKAEPLPPAPASKDKSK